MKIFNNYLFRVMSTWFGNYVQHKFDEVQKRYAGAVYLTQSEYDALTDEQKNDTTKVYYVEEQLS